MKTLSLAEYDPAQIPPSALRVQIDGASGTVTIWEEGDELPPPPPEPVVPDWEGFRRAIATCPAYHRIAATNLVVNQLLVSALWAGAFEDVPALWNAIALQGKPTHEEIAALNELAESSSVPFRLDARGLMGREEP